MLQWTNERGMGSSRPYKLPHKGHESPANKGNYNHHNNNNNSNNNDNNNNNNNNNDNRTLFHKGEAH